MARSKGDLMRAQGKRCSGRKSFPNLRGINIPREERDEIINIQLNRICELLFGTVRQVKSWLNEIDRLDDGEDTNI